VSWTGLCALDQAEVDQVPVRLRPAASFPRKRAGFRRAPFAKPPRLSKAYTVSTNVAEWPGRRRSYRTHRRKWALRGASMGAHRLMDVAATNGPRTPVNSMRCREIMGIVFERASRRIDGGVQRLRASPTYWPSIPRRRSPLLVGAGRSDSRSYPEPESGRSAELLESFIEPDRTRAAADLFRALAVAKTRLQRSRPVGQRSQRVGSSRSMKCSRAWAPSIPGSARERSGQAQGRDTRFVDGPSGPQKWRNGRAGRAAACQLG